MRSMIKLPRQFSLLLGLLLLGALSPSFAQYGGDPSGRVARLSDIAGAVSYSPGGESDWVRASRNRPLISGDRLWTDNRARAELQIGQSALRLDQYSALSILGLDDQFAQVELTQGTLNLRVRGIYEDQEYEIATPVLALAITERGRYRVDVDPRDGVTTVVVLEGSATAYGERSSFPLYAGEAVRFYDASLSDYELFSLPRTDAFDRYCLARDVRLERSASLRYVDDDLIGYSDLDDYGYWRTESGYGAVWYPERVDRNWAPYRDGHWAWQEPWGWTWVDDAPWGFAPSHYGRWAWIGGRWGWTPGPRGQRAVYAPALVAFVGGDNWSLSVTSGHDPIGWFPLGPRDVYVPSYRASRDYFNRVNIHNSSVSITVVGSAYRGYASGRPNLSGVRYANRGIAGALTAVSADVFTSAQQVRGSTLQLARDDSARAEVMHLARVAPTRESLVGSPAATSGRPGKEAFSREVIARTAPPPGLQSFESRSRGLQRNPGMPTESVPASKPSRGRKNDQAQRVRVIGTQPGAVETRSTNDRARAALDRQVERSAGDRARAPADNAKPDGRSTAPRGNAPTTRQTPEQARAEQQRVDAAQSARTAEQARTDEAREQQRVQESRQRVEQNAREQLQERQRSQNQNQESQRQREAEAQQQQARTQREAAQQQQDRVEREVEEQRVRGEREAAQRQQQEQARAQREAEQQEQVRGQREAAQQEQVRAQRDAAQQEQVRAQREAEQQQARAQREAAQQEQVRAQQAERERAQANRAEQQERLRAEQERADRAQQERAQAEQPASQQNNGGGSERGAQPERSSRPERAPRENKNDESDDSEESEKSDKSDKSERRRDRED